ncbi:L-cysteine desulfhydrase [Streptococcus infantarius subsp. infantarius]|nr:L-cysteine desulfhydrase [Streptococcus infantarius subsp. infantarius]MCO4474434.1 L-cysteine desulfhydrase [Streptococcus infantarius subsp. infantarius]MCO4476029.1 L-cysteine desulfhydrase [Streptococcus infantarius subsp. infantarius]MCO4478457.1 L-cysteine desulfhydrase [Streptococcus infantarius subsp. infantarius]
MGKYDFTTRPNRLKQFTYKWQSSENNPDLLQLWVADMDFLPVPEIKQAIIDYGQEHIFGYNYFKDSLYQAVIDWEKEEHGYGIKQEEISFIDGVVPAISVAIQAFTEKGDAVLINSPVYYPFARTIRLNDRKLVENSLQIKNGHFEIDFDQLEKDIVDNQVKLYVFCSPHNPGGRVWSSDELQKLGDLCRKHGVILISDEIHQDLALFGHKHHSFNTVDDSFKDFSLILSSATKTFNIAGTKNSFAIIENDQLRKTFQRQQLANNQHEVPAIGLITTEAAFTYGKPWLEELKTVLEKNIDYVVDELSQKTKIKVMKPEGTYLIWLDFSAYGIEQPELDERLQKEAKVVLNNGASFGKEGQTYARFNVAAPFVTVKEAIQRIVRVFSK